MAVCTSKPLEPLHARHQGHKGAHAGRRRPAQLPASTNSLQRLMPPARDRHGSRTQIRPPAATRQDSANQLSCLGSLSSIYTPILHVLPPTPSSSLPLTIRLASVATVSSARPVPRSEPTCRLSYISSPGFWVKSSPNRFFSDTRCLENLSSGENRAADVGTRHSPSQIRPRAPSPLPSPQPLPPFFPPTAPAAPRTGVRGVRGRAVGRGLLQRVDALAVGANVEHEVHGCVCVLEPSLARATASGTQESTIHIVRVFRGSMDVRSSSCERERM